MIKQTLLFSTLFISISLKVSGQFENDSTDIDETPVYHNKEDEIIDKYYKTYSTWVIATPTAIVMKRFSPDYGLTWKRAKILGGNLRPYLKDNQEALRYLNIYRTIRIAGIIQMWIISPYFLFRQIQADNDYETNRKNGTIPLDADINTTNLMQYAIFAVTGSITYHLISKRYFKKALISYYNSKNSTSKMRDYIPTIGLSYDYQTQKPLIALRWYL